MTPRLHQACLDLNGCLPLYEASTEGSEPWRYYGRELRSLRKTVKRMAIIEGLDPEAVLLWAETDTDTPMEEPT